MKQIKIKDKKIKVPESWSEITVGEYLTMMFTLETHKGNKNDIEIMINIISDLYGFSKEELLDENTAKVGEIIESFSFISENIPTIKVKKVFKINNEDYVFKTDFNNLTLGESISIETLIQSGENLQFELDKIVAVLLRKIDNKGKVENFDSSKINDYIKLVREMKLIDVYQLSLFFYSGAKNSIQ